MIYILLFLLGVAAGWAFEERYYALFGALVALCASLIFLSTVLENAP